MRPENLITLENITRYCDVCQRYAAAPIQFRITMPSTTCTLNKTLSIDLMTLEKSIVVHLFESSTKFEAARLAADVTTEGMWKLFKVMWVNVYLRYRDTISYDQGPQFSNAT